MADEEPITKFIEKMEVFCNDCYINASFHEKNGHEEGLGFYYFGRCVSCFMGIKTILFTLDIASSNANFGKEYISKILPSQFPRRDNEIAEAYIKETYTVSRFALFQNFYSQTEFTYRIIQREKYPLETQTNPFRLMVDKYDIMSVDFIKFINAIRNTIHNNGYYFPSKGDLSLNYTFNSKTFLFEYGKPIDIVTMEDILKIIEYVLAENKKLLLIPNLAEIKFT